MLNDAGDYDLYEWDADSWVESCGGVLLNGPPQSGKTTSLLTFPAPRHIIIAPREQGYTSIKEDKDTKIYNFKFPTVKDASRYQAIWKAVQDITAEIIAGTYGEVATIAIDGLHKMYYIIQKAHGYNYGTDSREFGKYHEIFTTYMDSILSSSIPHRVATCYDGVEMIDEEGTDKKKQAIYVQLPGRMAKDILGAFPLVFHTEKSTERVNGKKTEVFSWRFRAGDKIHAAGGHLPREIRDIFPESVEQDWNAVVSLIKKQTKVDLDKELKKVYGELETNSKTTRKNGSNKSGSNKTKRTR